MIILLPALAVAFAAFCVWLTVRIVNRREKWTKRKLLIAVVGLPLLYVLSSGPMRSAAFSRYISRMGITDGSGRFNETEHMDVSDWWLDIYAPLFWASNQSWGVPVKWYWSLFPIRQRFDFSIEKGTTRLQ